MLIGCAKVIRETWNLNSTEENDVAVWENVNNCRVGLMWWSRQESGKEERQIRAIEKELESLDSERSSEAAHNRKVELKKELIGLLKDQEI